MAEKKTFTTTAIAELSKINPLIDFGRTSACEFRRKLDSDSSRSWTVIPRQAGH